MNWRSWGKGDISLQNSAPVSETLNIINIYLLENSLLFAMQFTVHIFSIFLQWCCFFGPATFKYFKFSSTTTLRLPACTVWPSLLIFFFHFYSFPTDHSVKSLRDSSEGLLLAIFLLYDTKNIFFKPSLPLRRGRLRPVQSVFFLPGVCETNSSNDRAWGKLRGDNCWYWRNCPGPVSSDHSCEAHQRTGVIVVSMEGGGGQG